MSSSSEEADLSSTDAEADEQGRTATDAGGTAASGAVRHQGRPSLAVYFMCKGGVGLSTCNAAIATSAWRKLRGEHDRRGRCPLCDAKYLEKWGALTEMCDFHDGAIRYQYGQACRPPQRIRDLRYRPLKQAQCGVYLFTPGASQEHILQSPRPLRNGWLGTEVLPGVYRLKATFDLLSEVGLADSLRPN